MSLIATGIVVTVNRTPSTVVRSLAEKNQEEQGEEREEREEEKERQDPTAKAWACSGQEEEEEKQESQAGGQRWRNGWYRRSVWSCSGEGRTQNQQRPRKAHVSRYVILASVPTTCKISQTSSYWRVKKMFVITKCIIDYNYAHFKPLLWHYPAGEWSQLERRHLSTKKHRIAIILD